MTLWCVAVAGSLLVSGWHLPTDIAGGVLAGLALAGWAADYEEAGAVDVDLGFVSSDSRSGSREHF